MTDNEFQDGEIVYFVTDVRRRRPMKVYDRANSPADQIKCLRRRPNGKDLPETFAPEHLMRKPVHKRATESLRRV